MPGCVCVTAHLSGGVTQLQSTQPHLIVQPLGGLLLQWEGEGEGNMPFPHLLQGALALALILAFAWWPQASHRALLSPSLWSKQDLNALTSARYCNHSWSSDYELAVVQEQRDFPANEGNTGPSTLVTGCCIPQLSGEQDGAVREGLTAPPSLPQQSSSELWPVLLGGQLCWQEKLHRKQNGFLEWGWLLLNWYQASHSVGHPAGITSPQPRPLLLLQRGVRDAVLQQLRRCTSTIAEERCC